MRRLLHRLLDRSRRDQRAAAVRYMAAIGHDLPLEERARTLRAHSRSAVFVLAEANVAMAEKLEKVGRLPDIWEYGGADASDCIANLRAVLGDES